MHGATCMARAPQFSTTRHTRLYMTSLHPLFSQAQGEWTEEEHATFLETARAHGVGDKWGLFASYLPQVGLQTSHGIERTFACRLLGAHCMSAGLQARSSVCLSARYWLARQHWCLLAVPPAPAACGLPVQCLLPRRHHPSRAGHRPPLQDDAQRPGSVRWLSGRQCVEAAAAAASCSSKVWEPAAPPCPKHAPRFAAQFIEITHDHRKP